MCKDRMAELFPVFKVEHLIKSCSDHTPMQLNFSAVKEHISKPFLFLNLWLKEEGFLEVTKKIRKTNFQGNPFMMFYHKQVNIALAKWSRKSFGNIFQEIATLEEVIEVREQ